MKKKWIWVPSSTSVINSRGLISLRYRSCVMMLKLRIAGLGCAVVKK